MPCVPVITLFWQSVKVYIYLLIYGVAVVGFLWITIPPLLWLTLSSFLRHLLRRMP